MNTTPRCKHGAVLEESRRAQGLAKASSCGTNETHVWQRGQSTQAEFMDPSYMLHHGCKRLPLLNYRHLLTIMQNGSCSLIIYWEEYYMPGLTQSQILIKTYKSHLQESLHQWGVSGKPGDKGQWLAWDHTANSTARLQPPRSCYHRLHQGSPPEGMLPFPRRENEGPNRFQSPGGRCQEPKPGCDLSLKLSRIPCQVSVYPNTKEPLSSLGILHSAPSG